MSQISRRFDRGVEAERERIFREVVAPVLEALETLSQLYGPCRCADPPYAPEEGEEGQVECEGCKARFALVNARAQMDKKESR